MVVEYIYLDDDGQIMYTSRNLPLRYEDQTECVVIRAENEYHMDKALDLMGLPKPLSKFQMKMQSIMDEQLERKMMVTELIYSNVSRNYSNMTDLEVEQLWLKNKNK